MFRRVFRRKLHNHFKQQASWINEEQAAEKQDPPAYVANAIVSPDDHIRLALAIYNQASPDDLVAWLNRATANTAYQLACLNLWYRYVAQYVVIWHNNDTTPAIDEAHALIFDRASDLVDRKACAMSMLASVSMSAQSLTEIQSQWRNVYHGYAAQIVVAWHIGHSVTAAVTAAVTALDQAIVDGIASEEVAAAKYAAREAAVAAEKAAIALAKKVALKAEIENAVSAANTLASSSKGAGLKLKNVCDSDAFQAAIDAAPHSTTVIMLVRRADNGRFNLKVGNYPCKRGSQCQIRSIRSSTTSSAATNVQFVRINGCYCESMTSKQIHDAFAAQQQAVYIECHIVNTDQPVDWWGTIV